MKRIDAALSSDNRQLVIWCQVGTDTRRQIILLDMKKIKDMLYGKNGTNYIDLSSDEGKKMVIPCHQLINQYYNRIDLFNLLKLVKRLVLKRTSGMGILRVEIQTNRIKSF